ncbi:MAG TPA: ATP-dependent DNA helicase RecG [Steroidobacteraceae bacterium]|nr:ATP-dependent DNA helicase RecG [Steroidobacteraceae bacterium]
MPGSSASQEQRPITALRGVGEALAHRLGRLGVAQVQDLLFVLPLRYEDRTTVVRIGSLLAGTRAVVEGEIQLAQVAYRRRRQLQCSLSDGSGFLTLRFFHFSASQQLSLARGTRLRCFGEVRRGPQGLEMVHPEYRRVSGGEAAPEETLTPVYPLTEGVPQGRLRALIAQALQELDRAAVRDWIPAQVLSSLDLLPLRDALRYVHRPPREAQLAELAAGRHPAQRRLAFEELLAHQASLRLLKRSAKTDPAWPLEDPDGLAARLTASLPFNLTDAQARALTEVDSDLRSRVPMVRLIQGDVGCGKTVVAAIAAARAAGTGLQAALMAPTELLAEQHWRSLSEWLRPLGLPVALLTSGQPARARRSALEAIASGEVRVIVGTHALFQEGIDFSSLALVIVDEQHRFGVQQRLTLRRKGEEVVPHQLMMSATPIPRTLSMTYFADLDVSVIDQLPPGRRPVATRLFSAGRRGELLERIRAACAERQQVYWVCPVIEESRDGDVQTAVETHALLAKELSGLGVALLHGRLAAAEKAQVMAHFAAGRTDVLVCTTVIEVGVDVPNASLMVIESAERFGLAQLHQLRGRIGRGARESVCILLYGEPLTEAARARLKVIFESTSGFEIAERDLELRGPGEYLGERQSGEPLLRFADLERDGELVARAVEAAQEMLERHPAAARAHVERWLGGRKDLLQT